MQYGRRDKCVIIVWTGKKVDIIVRSVLYLHGSKETDGPLVQN
jgi:hypothetical protein